VSNRIGRIALAFLVLALAAGSVAIPASADHGGAVVAKSKSKCKKKKAKRAAAAKKKKCKRGGAGGAATSLPGQATHPTTTQPKLPPQPPVPQARQVSSVTLTTGTVLGGNSTSGQVTLDDVAPTGGQQVDLTSDVPARVKVPASVVVISGQKTASFLVDTSFGAPVTAMLKGSIGASNATAALKVVDRPSVASVKLQRQCFAPGTWPTNRVTLDIPAPDDTIVALGSDSASLELPLPTVTVPSGSTSALFSVSVDPLAAPAEATVSATAPSTPTQSDSAFVNPTDPPKAADLQLNPSTVVPSESSTGTVTLDCEAPPGTQVTLTSSDPAVEVPTSLDVDEDDLSADFTITVTGTPEGGSATISATAGGVTKDAMLIVSQPD
jgi:hypothetical protein